MPQRAYYLPERGVVCLDGIWEFCYFGSVGELCVSPRCTKIEIPSVWQTQGFDECVYSDDKYPFPFHPPRVPEKVPCGYYRKSVYLKKEAGRYYFRAEGGDFYYLIVNDCLAGYSSVAHSGEDFDITPYIADGENILEIVCVKWSAGSYFECQDKIRMSGMFRSLYLLHRPENCLWDYFIRPDLSDLKRAVVRVEFTGAEGEEKRIVFSKAGKICAEAVTEGRSAELVLTDPALWNPENPQLYEVAIEAVGERILQRYALRRAGIEGGVFCLNGRPVKLLGVNRHESYADTGYAVTREKMRKDVEMIKACNLNCVRTSHYPDDPYFLELCDEAGLMVVDEADLECHGVLYANGVYDFNLYDLLTDDERWRDIISDRVSRLVERDKNFGCVVFWSVGNESGYGRCIREAVRAVKERDGSRVVHYENINVRKEKNYEGHFEELDVISRMYWSIPQIRNYLSGKDEETSCGILRYDSKTYLRPLFLCEYAHAMGTGPGGLSEYVQIFFSEEKVIGGCVWEWNDHTVLGNLGKRKNTPLYGGDFHNPADDRINSGNFCMDGLIGYDRKPHSGYYELKNLCRPIVVTRENGGFYAESRRFFEDVGAEYKTVATFSAGGKRISRSEIEIGSLKPREKKRIRLSLPKGCCEATFEYFPKREKPFSGRGSAGFDQILLSEPKTEIPFTPAAVSVKREGETIFLTADGCRYAFDARACNFLSVCRNGREYLKDPMRFCLMRAPLDNDMWMKERFRAYGLDEFTVRGEYVRLKENALEAGCVLQALFRRDIARIDAKYLFGTDGVVRCEYAVRVGEHIGFLPRFGILLPLLMRDAVCEYFGNGPRESYADFHSGAKRGLYRYAVKECLCTHVKPQEYGSHDGTDFVRISAGGGEVRVLSGEKFSFSALPFTPEELTKKKHACELKKYGGTVLCADYKMSGLGSGSCGPYTADEYLLKEKEFTFCFTVQWG